MSSGDQTGPSGTSQAKKAGGWAPGRRRRALIGLASLGLLALAYLALSRSGILDDLLEGEALRAAVAELGAAGPLLIVGLMTLAIVMSPIPSAPIALAAGAAYGHVWGTVYVATGAELGALLAFAIARLAGYGTVRAWLDQRVSTGVFARFLGSQNALMATVFATRLMPFLSFDMISYAAGLTPLAPWRFAVATLLGIIPASFLLAHFGGEFASANPDRAALAALALGGLILLPIAGKLVLDRWRRAARERRAGR